MRLTVGALVYGVTLAFVLFARSDAAMAQAGRTIWDGVYSEEQAARGRELYASVCATCHKEDLSGERGPNLADEAFFIRFNADNLGRIYTSILTRMPQDNPKSLRPEQAAELVAFLLQFNKIPSGSEALAASADALGSITVVRKDGGGEVPNFSLVQVVGCLTQSGNAWVVASASAPVITKNPEPSKDAELTQAVGRALGSETFGLMLLSVQPSAVAPHAGSKVEAKGLLIRGPQNRLNLTSIQPVAPSCS